MEVNIFDLSSNPDEFIPKTKNNLELYKPDLEKHGIGGVYDAVFRFVPYHKSPAQSIASKRVAWITDPASGVSRYVDCYPNCPITTTFWKLKKSKRKEEVALSSKFNSFQHFYALVQIIEDKHQPNLEGKILVFKFGMSIKQKIDLEITPTSERSKRRVPFDLFNGRAFNLHIYKKGEWPNYDLSKFLEEEQPLLVDGQAIDKATCNQELVLKYLQENSPDLSKYECQPWDEETEQFVFSSISRTVPNESIVGNAVRAASSAKSSTTPEFTDDAGFEDDDLEVSVLDSDFDVDVDDLDEIDA